MKALEWMRYLRQQQIEHGKTVFTVSELANVASSSPAVTNVTLGRLVKRGVLDRIARGVYGLPGAVTVDDLLPFVDGGAYITGARVLFDEGFVTQSPSVTLCFTDRRPFRAGRDTGVGRLRFHVVKPPVYAPPESGVRARPEQALLDLVWTTPGSADLRSLYTFRNTSTLKRSILHRMARRYPPGVGERAMDLMVCAARAG